MTQKISVAIFFSASTFGLRHRGGYRLLNVRWSTQRPISAMRSSKTVCLVWHGVANEETADPPGELYQPALRCRPHPGELPKLGREVREATVGRHLPRYPKAPSPTWRSFCTTN